MKITYTLDSNKNIISFCTTNGLDFPNIDLTAEEIQSIRIGYSQIINNKLIINEDKYIEVITKQHTQQEINQLKSQLQSTDYLTMKYMEGQLSEEE